MSPTHLTTRPAPARSRGVQLAAAFALVVLALAFFVGVSRATAVPGTVERIVILNDTDYGLDVDVRGTDDDERLMLGRALPQRETDRHDVQDVGDRWRFEFRSGGAVIGEVDVPRADLAAAGWQVTVPDSVAQTLDVSARNAYPEEGSR